MLVRSVITSLALVSTLHAANISQVSSNRSWLDPEAWSNNAAPSVRNDYFLREGTGPPDPVGARGLLFTTPAGTINSGSSTNFNGRSLEVSQSEILTVRQTGTRTASIRDGAGNLILRGGSIHFRPQQRGSRPTLKVNRFEVQRTDRSTSIQLVTNTRAIIDGELRGSGNISIFERRRGNVSNASLTFTEVNSNRFTGNISVRDDITLDFNSDVTFQGTLAINREAKLNVDQTLRFQSGKLSDSENGTLPDGVYLGPSLAALGGKYVDNGGALIVGENPPPPVFTVITLADEVATPGTGLSLREAIDILPFGIIDFDPSLDGGTIQLDPARGPLRMTRGITIDASALPNGIIIDGGSNGDRTKDSNETRCLVIDDEQETNRISVTLRGLTIQNGVAAREGESSNQRDNGANIYLAETLTLENCQVLNGRVAGTLVRTGGIYGEVGSRLTVRDSLIDGNTQNGINFRNELSVSTRGSILTITRSTISNNGSAMRCQAPGFGAAQGGSVEIVDSLISNNSGGITTFGVALRMRNCTIANNNATGTNADGGGINFFSGTDLSLGITEMDLINCTIVGNSATRSGGGVHHIGPLGLAGRFSTITNCTIIGNSSRDGGGIENFRGSDKIRIANSLIIGNNASRNGGDTAGGFINGGGNRIGLPRGASLATLVKTASGNALLQDNGGPTPTVDLVENSPAIDAGNDSNIPDGITTDQRGFTRISGARVDIGAVERIQFGAEISLIENRLVISEMNGPMDNRLEISNNNGDYRISDTNGLAFDTSSVPGAVGNGSSSVTIPRGSIDQLEINTLAGNDSITLQSLPGTLAAGLVINGGAGTDSIMIAGLLDTGEAGTVTLTAESISQSAGIIAGGVTSLTAEDITLESTANDFGILSATASNISIVDSNTITLDQITATGDFSLATPSGDILDTPSARILVDGAASFITAQDILLDHFDEHIFEGLVTLTANRIINFATIENITFGKITVTGTANRGSRIQSGNGTVTLTDDVTTAGNSDLQIRIRGNVVQQGGRIITDGLAIIATRPNIQANLPGENDVRQFTSGTRIGDQRVGPILYNDINEVQLGGIRSDQFTLTAGGDVRSVSPMILQGASSITVAGDYSIENTVQLSDTLSLNISGVTSITENATLEVLAAPSVFPPFELIRKNDSSFILGTFSNAPEGASVTTSSGPFLVSYLGGDGNDIVLTADSTSDFDSDGLPLAVELAIGTDPDTPSFGDPNLPSIGFTENGTDIQFAFGRGTDPLPGTVLIIEFSTTLEDSSFTEVYRFDVDTNTGTPAPGIEWTINVTADRFIAITTTGDTGFFRLRIG